MVDRVLVRASLNPRVLEAKYAVRGKIALLAESLRVQLASGVSLPFSKVTQCNIGNPQLLGQSPISYYRQICALLECPSLINRPPSALGFSEDVFERAREMLRCMESVGAYSHSKGFPYIREKVSTFLEKRDGHPIHPEHIFLTSGASAGITYLLQAIISHPKVGILIPRPQYPLYSAVITLFGGNIVYYDLDENNAWSLSLPDLEKAYQEAVARGLDMRAFCMINPGNPTGNLFSRSDIEQIVHFCRHHHLVLLADEVYQDNVYYPDTKPFISAIKVVAEMKDPLDKTLETFSFNSTSKGLLGECGRRGGYFICSNIDEQVVEELYKLASINLCPTTFGQIMVDLMVDGPTLGSPSYDSFIQEKLIIYESLKRRSIKLVSALQHLEGISCQLPEGAMYVFPSYVFPVAFLKEAESLGLDADFLYCEKLLSETGICAVNGGGFGQKEGTFHLRFTFLPPEDSFEEFLQMLVHFHQHFMDSYRN